MDGQQANDGTEILSFEFAIVTEKLQKKAELELNEAYESRRTCLTELKELIKNKKNLKNATTDEFLLRFLRAKKFRTKDAFSLVQNYYEQRVRFPALYQDYRRETCTTAFKENLLGFSPFRAPDGSAIWVMRLGPWHPDLFSSKEFVKLQLISLEEALKNPVTQICGVTVLVDVKESSLFQVRHFNFQDVRCLITNMQDALPLRVRGIHVVNNSAFFNILYAMCRPFLKQKIKNRVIFHGLDFQGLHKFLPSSILPEEYGGTNCSLLNEEFYSSLLERMGDANNS